MPYGNVPAGGADHTQEHRDIVTALDTATAALVPDASNQSIGDVLAADGAGGYAWQQIDTPLSDATLYGRLGTGTTLAVDATDGHVWTADGLGGGTWEAPTGGGGGTPGVDYPTKATVTLSSADILALDSTPVTLVGAPGAGKWLNVHRVAAYLTYGTTPYTLTDGSPLVRYAPGGSGVTLTGLMPMSEDATLSGPWPQLYSQATTTTNQPIQFVADGALTDGDSTLTFVIWYSIEDVP